MHAPRSAYEYVIPAHGKECVKTDISIHVPAGTYGRIAPRSVAMQPCTLHRARMDWLKPRCPNPTVT